MIYACVYMCYAEVHRYVHMSMGGSFNKPTYFCGQSVTNII